MNINGRHDAASETMLAKGTRSDSRHVKSPKVRWQDRHIQWIPEPIGKQFSFGLRWMLYIDHQPAGRIIKAFPDRWCWAKRGQETVLANGSTATEAALELLESL